jgi:translation initiation factor IF-1
MMAKDDLVEFDGIVTDVLAGSTFKVAVKNNDGSTGHVVLCYLSGKIRQNNIRITLHDQVRIAVSPYDPSRGKIIYRSK